MTDKQRKFIVKRDGNKCQYRSFRNGKLCQCFQTGNLEVHHIFSKRFMTKWFPDIDPDHPLNMITLCVYHHQNVVHPDIADAFKGDHVTGVDYALEAIMTNRDMMVNEGKIYWDSKCDGMFYMLARINSTNCQDEFPEKRKVKK